MLKIHCIPAFQDNYFWLIQPDTASRDAFIIDPGDSQPVKKVLEEKHLELKAILLTHHHHDHIDGADALRQTFKVPVYGPSSPRMPQVTHMLRDGDQVSLGPVSARVIALAGHTLDHIGYLIESPGSAPRLFSGDTLFAAGCGRLFDGTAPLLFRALQKIAALPDNTLIYAAHEYTLANIAFARHIEPDNIDLVDREQAETEKRNRGEPTLPTKLSLEKRTNPFLRCHLAPVREQAERYAGRKLLDEADVFTSLRQAKDNF